MMSTWVAVVLLLRVPQRRRDPFTLGGVVVDQIGDPKEALLGCLHQLESGLRIGALPLAEFLEDVLDLPDLVLGALARVDAGNAGRSSSRRD